MIDNKTPLTPVDCRAMAPHAHNPIHRWAKQYVEHFQDAYPIVSEDADENPAHAFYVHCKQPTIPHAMIALLNHACKTFHPNALCCYDDKAQSIDFLFPTSIQKMPTRALCVQLDKTNRALQNSLKANNDGTYRLYASPGLNLDADHLLEMLMMDYATKCRAVEYISNDTEDLTCMNFHRLPKGQRPEYACYYQMPGGEQLLTQDELEMHNAKIGENNRVYIDPKQAFHHADMNPAMMQLLSYALGMQAEQAKEGRKRGATLQ